MKQAKLLSRSNLLLCAGLLSAAVLTGCGKEEITVYNAPKDIATSHPAAEAAEARESQPAEASRPPAIPPITWKTPANWEQLAPTTMRVGNFSVSEGDKEANIGILPFPLSIGGELDNVNRWRDELGLKPVQEGEYKSEPVTIGSDPAKLYTLTGETNGTVAAWMEKDGVHWFFKLKGDKELVARNKPILIEFLKSIEIGKAGNQEEVVKSEARQKEPSEAETASEQGDGPKWQIPSHWKQGPKKPMVDRNWDITGEGDKKANVAVSSFEGDAGGLTANINRWRGQLSLPPMSEKEVQRAIKTLETSDGHSELVYVDFTGKDRSGQPARMVAAVVPHGGFTWYYKILGNGDVVEKEKSTFLKMVQTASYH